MARSPRNPTAQEVPSPTFERSDDAGSKQDALWVIAQHVHELTADFSKVSTKTDRLIEDAKDVAKDVKELRGSLQWAKGFGVAAIILIPICAGFVWWLIGAKLNDIRDQLYQSKPAAVAAPGSPKTTDKP